MKYNDNYRSGFVAIIGKPNVGKSTLLNRLVGEKLSIVTPKPQTTRHSIKGFYSDENRQIVFLDTPGFLIPRYELQRRMMLAIEDAVISSDLIVYITDQLFPTDYDKQLCTELQKYKKIPRIAVLNKADLMSDEKISDIKCRLMDIGFLTVTSISALNDDSFVDLLEVITGYLPLSPPLYPPEDLSDLPVRFFAQEIIREQIFLHLRDEIPYSSTVTVERFNESDKKVEIYANVWLERKTQKIIFIGNKGKMIRLITESAEKELYKFLHKRVKVELWVKIKLNWRKKKNAVKEFGYF